MGRAYGRKKANAPMLRGDEAKARIRWLLESDRTLFLKVQTTGLDDSARVISLTLASLGGRYEKHIVNPGFDIPDETEDYTGLPRELVSDGRTWKEGLAGEIADILEGYAVVGWNIGFDARAIRHEQELAIPGDDPFRTVLDMADAMELYSGAIGKDTRFTRLSEAIGHTPPRESIAYLEAVMDALRRVSAC